jgi:hypothetical protein
LSRDPGEEVPFSEIVVSLVHMAEDSVVGPGLIEISVDGDLGDVSAVVATPLAVVIAELLQNAVEHGFPGADTDAFELDESDAPATVGQVGLTLRHDRSALQIGVRDDGVGLPPDFVTSQLGGTILMASDSEGTVVDIRVALDSEDGDTW